jgi:hypothetical protein
MDSPPFIALFPARSSIGTLAIPYATRLVKDWALATPTFCQAYNVKHPFQLSIASACNYHQQNEQYKDYTNVVAVKSSRTTHDFHPFFFINQRHSCHQSQEQAMITSRMNRTKITPTPSIPLQQLIFSLLPARALNHLTCYILCLGRANGLDARPFSDKKKSP